MIKSLSSRFFCLLTNFSNGVKLRHKINFRRVVMYYSAGTYEAFAHPEKPKDVDKKSAYIIGTGLAGLTAAFYLVRDGQMKGEHIHLF